MFDELKQRHRTVRDDYPENLNLRVHRALSWLKAAESVDDSDQQFIFLWIAFNAAYATEMDDRYRIAEQEAFGEFIGKLCELDNEGSLEKLIWNEFPGAIRNLLKNQYIFAAFWDFQIGKIDEATWTRRFAEANKLAHNALGERDTKTAVCITLSRIYTLRNQMVHGGATWQSQVNRDQIRDCVKFMLKLVPAIITVMLDNPNTLWGDPSFPVVKA